MFKSVRLNERREGYDILKNGLKDKNKVLLIHYSCESFTAAHGRTPRITSISIGKYSTGERKSFSIHLQAQINNMDFRNLSNEQYDETEKKMLETYYEYLSEHKNYSWFHWKMNNSGFGFEAIDNRMRILKGNPVSIEEDRKIDLSKIVVNSHASIVEKPSFLPN